MTFELSVTLWIKTLEQLQNSNWLNRLLSTVLPAFELKQRAKHCGGFNIFWETFETMNRGTVVCGNMEP